MYFRLFILTTDIASASTVQNVLSTFLQSHTDTCSLVTTDLLKDDTFYFIYHATVLKDTFLVELEQLLELLVQDFYSTETISYYYSQLFPDTTTPEDAILASQSITTYLGIDHKTTSYAQLLLQHILTGTCSVDEAIEIIRLDALSTLQYKIIKALLRLNGNISAVADLLFMHRNSIQYQLNQIMSITGLDPRRTGDALLLHFIFSIQI